MVVYNCKAGIVTGRIHRSLLTGSLLFILCLSGYAQTSNDRWKLHQAKLDAIKHWFINPDFRSDLLDTNLVKQLIDSGRTVRHVKSGYWKEFSIDTSVSGISVSFGNHNVGSIGTPTIIKHCGVYRRGEKTGVWTEYRTSDSELPLSWDKYSTTEYKNGLKTGEEILYQGYGVRDVRPFLIRHWENGVEVGIGEVYYLNAPYKLQTRYKVVNGTEQITETFYPDGRLKASYTDSLVNGQNLLFLRQYFTDGTLSFTGFYFNLTSKTGTWTAYYPNGKIQSITNYADGKLDGDYKYFHDNGQLWIEETFRNDLLMEVLSNYDRNGNKEDRGTLSNGTGTVILYDEAGVVTKTIEYKDGVEVQH